MYITNGPHTCTSLTPLSWRTRLGAGLFIYIFICHGDPYHLLFELPAGSSQGRQGRKWNCQSKRIDRIEKSIPKLSPNATQPPNQKVQPQPHPNFLTLLSLLMFMDAESSCCSPLQPPTATNILHWRLESRCRITVWQLTFCTKGRTEGLRSYGRFHCDVEPF